MATGKFTVYVNEPVVPNTEQQEFAKLLEVAGTPSNYEEFRELWKHKWEPAMGKTIRVFRSDASPLWEHKCNASGGKLGLIVKEGDRADSHFLKIVAAMMRGELSESDKINGVLLSLRRTGYSIAVWHSTAQSTADCVELECDLRILLDTTDLNFRTHKELQEISSQPKPTKPAPHKLERVEPRFNTENRRDGVPNKKKVEPDIVATKCDRRRTRKQPKYTLAELEQQWEKDWQEQRQWEAEQKWTSSEWLCGMVIFGITATITTSMVSLY
jgi:hypothetical protein